MQAHQTDSSPIVGIIANPVSARDIRRIIANASNLQTSERVNIVLRVLGALAASGVRRVLMMPDKSGIRAMLLRRLRQNGQQQYFPTVEFIDMLVTGSVDDTFLATRYMQKAGVKAIVVLGGDGTHRAVVRELIRGVSQGVASVPIAGLSTGTNNTYPEMREPTITALAVGLYATGRLDAAQALVQNKVLEVAVDGEPRDIAIVDAVISSDRIIGTRALWKPDSLDAVYLSFADPQAIGLSAIGGLLQPVTRTEPDGLAIRLAHPGVLPQFRLNVPLAPGMMSQVGIADWKRMPADRQFAVPRQAGAVALDGERDFTFDADQQISITLRTGAFSSINVSRCMLTAAREGLYRDSSPHP